jgi:hypothetical protein
MTARQLSGWLKWMNHYKITPDRDDLLWGMLCAVTANAWGGHSSPEEFMPYQDEANRYDFAGDDELTDEELRAHLIMRLGLS